MSIKILQAITSVRVGDGASTGAMDLPLARERHTRWPFTPGSSLKGALRARIQDSVEPDREIAVFGSRPPGSGDDEHLEPGTLRVQQATLLALPVRSLKATFALLTCPTALARFGQATGSTLPLPAPTLQDACIAPDQADALGQRQRGIGGSFAGVVWLEDLDLVGVLSPEVRPWIDHIQAFTGDEAPLDQLVVVCDEIFSHATQVWTEHRTRNKVGPAGTVEDGFLYTVETLPAETLWWTAVEGEDGGLLPADGEPFAIGGHRSVGHGRVVWYGRQA